MTQLVQQLYHMLERLHELFLPGVASVNMYYDADDDAIAFNQDNQLWYNADADHVYDASQQGFRLWYLTGTSLSVTSWLTSSAKSMMRCSVHILRRLLCNRAHYDISYVQEVSY